MFFVLSFLLSTEFCLSIFPAFPYLDQKMSLQSLPEEVLVLILSYLPSHADAAALSLQCRRWHRLCDMATRRKYRRVKLREPLDLAMAFRILQSILKTPRYGRYVRHIELNRSPSLFHRIVRSYTMNPPQRSLKPKDQDRLTMAIRRAGFESPQEQEKMLNILLQDPVSMQYDCPLPAIFVFHCITKE